MIIIITVIIIVLLLTCKQRCMSSNDEQRRVSLKMLPSVCRVADVTWLLMSVVLRARCT